MGLVYSLTGLSVLFFSAILASKIKSLCTCKSVGVGESQMLEVIVNRDPQGLGIFVLLQC